MDTSTVEAPARTALKISFPVSAVIGEVESAIDASWHSHEPYPDSVELDLSNSEYIEVASLLFFASFIADRCRKGLRTRIRLPKKKNVRDFLRVWRFPEAIRRAARISFLELACEEDFRYFGENKAESEICYSGSLPDPGVQKLLSNRFFAIHNFPLSPVRSGARLVVDESSRWEYGLIKSVLAKHLRGPDGYLASRVVFESMTNAIRHPQAELIQTVSMFDAPGEEQAGSAGHFTIVYWDDGDSMVDTLKRAIHEGKSVRAKGVTVAFDTFRVVLQEGFAKRSPPELVKSDFTPSRATPDWKLLLSTGFPGITRDVEGKGHVIHPDLKREHPEYAAPGMGLYTLINTVVDIFGGMISFRTREFFMNVKRAIRTDKDAKYRAKIRILPEHTPKFLGNMLTIRLPLR